MHPTVLTRLKHLLAYAGMRFLAVAAVLAMPSTAHGQRITTSVDVPQGTLSDLAIDQILNKVYVNDMGCGCVYAFDGATNRYKTITTGGRIGVAYDAESIAVNPETHKVYALYGNNTVAIIDGTTDKLIKTLFIGIQPVDIAINLVNRRVYIVAKDNNTVAVLDGDTDKQVAVLLPATDPVAVAVNPVNGLVYVADEFTDSRDLGSISVFDSGNKKVTTIKVAPHPTALAVDPTTGLVFVLHVNSATLTTIDRAYQVSTMQLTRRGYSLAINPATHKVYVGLTEQSVEVIDEMQQAPPVLVDATVLRDNVPGFIRVIVDVLSNTTYAASTFDSDTIAAIDGDHLDTKPTGVNVRTHAIAVNGVTGKVYGISIGTLTVVDGAIDRIAVANAGRAADVVAVNPATNRIAVTNTGSASVTILNGATDTPFPPIPVGLSPTGAVYNPFTNRLYVANSSSNSVTVIGPFGPFLTIPTGRDPAAIALDSVSYTAYVANYVDGTVSVIDDNLAVIATIATGAAPSRIAVNPATHRAYVANTLSNTVSVIEGAALVANIPVGAQPGGIAVNPATNKIYVANAADGSLMAIDGATNGVTALALPQGAGVVDVDVNAVTNRIYAVDNSRRAVIVIDGANNAVIRSVTVQPSPSGIAVNPASNTIYVACLSNGISIIDGATNAVWSVDPPTASSPTWQVAVNVATRKVYTSNNLFDQGVVIALAEANVFPVPLTTTIQKLPNDATMTQVTELRFSHTALYGPTTPAPRFPYYQIDTMQGPWLRGTNVPGGWKGNTPPLGLGPHVVYAFFTDPQGTSKSPMTGKIAAYLFNVVGQLPPPPQGGGGGNAIRPTDSADLNVAVEAAPTALGGARYNIRVSNAGPAAASSVVVANVLPPQFVLQDCSSTGGGVCGVGGGAQTIAFDALDAGASADIVIDAVIGSFETFPPLDVSGFDVSLIDATGFGPGALGGDEWVDVVTVDSPTFDPVLSNNVASAAVAAADASGADVEPPRITGASVSPATLWPPNGTMRDITLAYAVSDNRASASQLVVTVTVASSDGGAADWQVVDGHRLRLRATRAGGDGPRYYLITVSAADPSGNQTSRTLTVTVPHDSRP